MSELMKTAPHVVLENKYVRYVIGSDGRNLHFIDKATRTDYFSTYSAASCFSLKRNGTTCLPTRCTWDNGNILLEFADIAVSVVVKVTGHESYFIFELVALNGADIDEFVLTDLILNMPGYDHGMTLNIVSNREFAVCLLALNLQVNVNPVPDTSVQIIGKEPFRSEKAALTAIAYPEFGFTGAKSALVACPSGEMRSVLKEIVREEKLPYSPLGGAWARDAAALKGSYLFAGTPDAASDTWLSERNVDDWIAVAKHAGMSCLLIYGGRQHWYGHYRPNPQFFPHGMDGLKHVVDKIHAAGLKAGIHTGTGCICKDDVWVSPAPDKRLAKDAVFTLAESLTVEATAIHTLESPENLPVESGYFVAGGTDMVINNEIISYGGISTVPPYGFINCVRGANATVPAAHEHGAQVAHLTERYALYLPDGESSLLEEIAANIAETVNYCGLDMIYLDGAEALGANGHGWHYIAKMKLAVMARLKNAIIMESACANHHSWHMRSRLGAWDSCHRGHKRYIDRHLQENRRYMNDLLPVQLGWRELHGAGSGVEALKPDEIEYLCAKCLAYDMPFSLMGISPVTLAANPLQQQLLGIIGQYERLRLNAYFSETVKAKLRHPRAEFKLEYADGERWDIKPVKYSAHTCGIENDDNVWMVENEYGAQPLACRIQALMSAAAYDDPGNMVLFASEQLAEQTENRTAVASKTDCMSFRVGTAMSGVTRDTQIEVDGTICYTAVNTTDRTGWARITKNFSPALNLTDKTALGIWVYGDGKGEILNFQLAGPGLMGMADHYVVIDYEGWKYHELIEPEGERVFDYSWPYSLLSAVRGEVPYSGICALNIYYNNIPPGETVKCRLKPVKALKTFGVPRKNPSITIGRQTIVFPVELMSGDWLEFASMSDCKFYNADGTVIREVKPVGGTPRLAAGKNRISFNVRAMSGSGARTKISIVKQGLSLMMDENTKMKMNKYRKTFFSTALVGTAEV